ncbi:single-stranded DNA-binding protein [Micromonosporaceae bacterium B7E4]
MSLPTVHGTARLTEDPELRFAASGTAVCKVRLAFNSRKKDASGEWVDGDVCFLDGTVFKQEAEHVAESLQRGLEVVVTGRLKTRKYETREGETRYAMELLIDAIGPTLRYATASVQKVQRGGSGPAPSGQAADDPWATATPAPAGQSRTARAVVGEPGDGSDEPPW